MECTQQLRYLTKVTGITRFQLPVISSPKHIHLGIGRDFHVMRITIHVGICLPVASCTITSRLLLMRWTNLNGSRFGNSYRYFAYRVSVVDLAVNEHSYCVYLGYNIVTWLSWSWPTVLPVRRLNPLRWQHRQGWGWFPNMVARRSHPDLYVRECIHAGIQAAEFGHRHPFIRTSRNFCLHIRF